MKKNQLLCLALAALLALCCVSALAESAAAPVCQQPTKDGKLHGHWYGEWFPTRVTHHTAFCRYDGCGEEREKLVRRTVDNPGISLLPLNDPDIWFDEDYILYAMGVLAQHYPEEVLSYMKEHVIKK